MENVSTGLFDINSIIKLIFGGATISFPGDKAKLKVAIAATGDWLKTLADVKWNLDDIMIDKVIELVDGFIDSAKAPAVNQPLIVGAGSGDDDATYTQEVAVSFMSTFAGLIPDETRQKIMANPKVIKSLRRLTRDQQIKVMNRQDLVDLLIKWGPVILQIVLAIIAIL